MAKSSGAATKARELIQYRRFAEAHTLLSQALRREPESDELHALMSDALGYLGRVGEGEQHVREAIRLNPSNGKYLQTLGDILMLTNRRDEAIAVMELAIERSGGTVEAYSQYASLMQMYWLQDRAVEVFERGLKAHPWNPDLLGPFVVALMKSGRPEEATHWTSEGARRHPDHLIMASLNAFVRNYPYEADPAATFDAHVHFGRTLAAKFPGEQVFKPDPAQAERRLRVGFISGDFWQHACMYFFEAVLASLDRRHFDTCCYSVGDMEDQKTAHIRKLSGMWRSCSTVDAPALARRIRSDRMDIVIELSGLTANNRLEALSLRTAPLQMTYLGYPNTTGVPAIDYRIVDSLTDPPGVADRFATEKLLRIDPCFLCYTGVPEAQVADAPPREKGEPLTFGSFNALQKVNDPTVRVWARILEANPGSRLAVKYMSTGDPSTRDRLKARLERCGVPAERQLLLDPKPVYRDHLESYGRVDIALDTFPYNGTTTTCEAMWMGVPVITLGKSPDVHAARVGISLLSAVGLSDLIAADEDDLVRIATTLASDRARLVELRANLRSRMLASPLCDRAAFGARFGGALRQAWRRWCGAPEPGASA